MLREVDVLSDVLLVEIELLVLCDVEDVLVEVE